MRLLDVLNESYKLGLSRPTSIAKVAKATRMDSAGSADTAALTHHFGIQEALRPLFGKGAPVPPSIGDHPDFVHLKGTDGSEYGPITTLFLDMEGSTRLSHFYPLEQVFRIKNAVIKSTIDIIKSFDGHVHRIMGDAVMAYFGRKTSAPADTAIDAVNCAVAVRALMERLLERQLPEMNSDKFGVRIGVDHGAAEHVLWSSYGYPGMDEVTATSFHVDAASKLQHTAGKNQIMIGQSLRELLDIPDVLVSTKTITRNGIEENEPYLLPNFSGGDGKPINYRKFVLDWEEYARCSPLAPHLGLGDNIGASISVADDEDDSAVTGPYHACASALKKDKHLRFDVQVSHQYRAPVEVEFRVENHGAEASRVDKNGNHSTIELPRDGSASRWEHTQYKGLHYMEVRVLSQHRQIAARRFGVWIQ